MSIKSIICAWTIKHTPSIVSIQIYSKCYTTRKKCQLGEKRIFFDLVFYDILNYFIEIYNPTTLQGLKLISLVITLIGHGKNGC